MYIMTYVHFHFTYNIVYIFRLGLVIIIRVNNAVTERFYDNKTIKLHFSTDM